MNDDYLRFAAVVKIDKLERRERLNDCKITRLQDWLIARLVD
jgi:hypothetical protein